MPFQRRILHHGPTPTGTPVLLSEQAITKCWFELHRQGGCGAAELSLSTTFEQRESIEIGDWISFAYSDGEPSYLGRVEERHTESPALLKLRLHGMAIQLNEVFPGGFGTNADGRKPHRYAATDLFTHDPDRSDETFDSITSANDLVKLLMAQYVVPQTDILYNPEQVETPTQSAPLTSLKLRGEESVRTILKELAIRSRSASWGVNAKGEFFFLRPANDMIATYQEGTSLTQLSEIRDYELLFNRILLTGDYVYDRREASEFIARRSFRWRGNFVEPASQSLFGDRRLKLWLPWIRTQADSIAFARELFRIYSQPANRYLIETTAQDVLPLPWMGTVSLKNIHDHHLITARIETVRVLFDHLPRFRMELGPEDPRNLWPEPPQDERWELPDKALSIGGSLSLSSSDTSPPPPPPPPPPPYSSNESSGNSTSIDSSESSNSSGSSDSSHSSESSGSYGSSNVTVSSDPLNTSSSNNTSDSNVDSSHSLTSYSSDYASDSSDVNSSLENSTTASTEDSSHNSSLNSSQANSASSGTDSSLASSSIGSSEPSHSNSSGPHSSQLSSAESQNTSHNSGNSSSATDSDFSSNNSQNSSQASSSYNLSLSSNGDSSHHNTASTYDSSLQHWSSDSSALTSRNSSSDLWNTTSTTHSPDS